MNVYELIRSECDDKYNAEMLCAMASAYQVAHGQWLQNVHVVAVEKTLEIDLGERYTLKGIIDKVVEAPHGRFIVDHKTTSEDIGNPNGWYFSRLTTDPQSTIYRILMIESDEEVDGIIWDVARKPKLTPGTLNAEAIIELRENGRYAGWRVKGSMEELTVELDDLYKAGKLKGEPKRAETPKLFGARCYHTIMDDLDKYFKFHKILRDDDDCIQCFDDLVKWASLIDVAYEGDIWPRNACNCHAFNSRCDYFDVCWQGKDISGGDYVYCEGTHYSISHSSIKTFSSCPVKFYYESVRRLRVEEVESEALKLGSVWHKAMDHLYGGLHE